MNNELLIDNKYYKLIINIINHYKLLKLQLLILFYIYNQNRTEKLLEFRRKLL